MFLNDWAIENFNKKKGIEALKNDFDITDEELEDVEILLASYTYEHYQGDAFVLFRKDGKLYEVNGSHCSCYGLEGQWSPEEVNLQELKNRAETHYNFDGFRDELKEVLLRLS